MRILVSGAGIAGPALALALADQHHDLTIVERASGLRPGGQAVDFRGPVHRAVLERLGLWDAIVERRTAGTDLVLLDRRGRPFVRLPAVMMSGDVEIVRGDLSRLLYERTAARVQYRFGDRVVAVEGNRVAFASGRSEHYDLVVAADGLHSGVRSLVFGDDASIVRHHGYRLAVFSQPDVLDVGTEALGYAVPGRSIMVSRDRAQLIFAGGPLGRERSDLEAMRAMIRRAYDGVGWHTPRVLAALDDADDLYVDQIATVAVERYATSSVVLLGDAAWGGTLGGQGTPLAFVGAYVLAGELARAEGDLASALSRYEARMRPYATRCQRGAARAGPFFAPRTGFGLWCRDLFYRAFTSRPLVGAFERMVKAGATAFELPAYP